MEFRDCLTLQLNMHPSIQPQDIVKMCYQATFGAEHLLSDENSAKKYFYEEYNGLQPAKDEPLYEIISEDVCRMNMRAWKNSGMPSEWLFRMFVGTASVGNLENNRAEKETLFWERINIAKEVLSQSQTSFDNKQWLVYINLYKEEGAHAVHHSVFYREHETPAYRIVNRKYVKLLPILQAACALEKEGTKVIAIDGRAASGKTTLAMALEEVLGVDTIHMDDFFVPPALRSEKRFAEPGNNIHYERYLEEVVPYVGEPEAFSYRIFDCSIMDYNGVQEVKNTPWRLIEGAYSTHPKFGDYADLKVFFDIGKEEQMARIIKRNGEAMAQMFKERWIPMEEAYYQTFDIKQNADIVICGGTKQ